MLFRSLDSSIRRGEWAKVLAVINAEPDQTSQTTWALKLRLADGYFAWGKYKEARDIYDKFFAQYPGGPPDQLKTFYYDSAYKFAQMLMLMKDDAAALKVYRMAIAGNPPRDTKRQFQADLADLLIKMADTSPPDVRGPLIAEVDKIASELM